jgi:hypothetical protein
MFWQRKKSNIVPPTSTPVQDIANLGPVVRHNHIAYVPAASWSLVPGVGVANLAYVPDFLITAPDFATGRSTRSGANRFVPVHRPVAIVAQPTVLNGVGGIVSGNTQLQQLLEVNYNLGNTTSE